MNTYFSQHSRLKSPVQRQEQMQNDRNDIIHPVRIHNTQYHYYNLACRLIKRNIFSLDNEYIYNYLIKSKWNDEDIYYFFCDYYDVIYDMLKNYIDDVNNDEKNNINKDNDNDTTLNKDTYEYMSIKLDEIDDFLNFMDEQYNAYDVNDSGYDASEEDYDY